MYGMHEMLLKKQHFFLYLYNNLKKINMKRIVLGILILVSFNSNAQETEFIFTSDKGMTDYVVAECLGKTKSDLYVKTNEWIVKTFKNPKEVIKGQTENEFIRIQGFSKKFNGVHDVTYIVEISFKDGKYKFDPISFILNYGTTEFNLFETFPSYFKTDGNVKERVKVTIDGSKGLMNDLNENLKNYINGIIETKNNEW
jgi:hypothetical protein